jgi:spore protease
MGFSRDKLRQAMDVLKEHPGWSKAGNIYTDLAREAREINPDIAGVTEQEENVEDASISRIEVQTVDAAQKLGKPVGRYVTIEAPSLAQRDTAVFEKWRRRCRRAGASAAGGGVEMGILVVGLETASSRRIRWAARSGEDVCDTAYHAAPAGYHRRAMRSVAAIAPGVLGTTGVERWKCCAGW